MKPNKLISKQSITGLVSACILAIPLQVSAVSLDMDIGIKISKDGISLRKTEETTSQPTSSKNPPAHAPAHGYHAKRKYQYYPSSEVYFDSGRGLYFYLSGSNWTMSATLPNSLKIRLGSHVSVEVESDKPYTKHASHKKQYPPGLAKAKNAKHHAHKNGKKGRKHKH